MPRMDKLSAYKTTVHTSEGWTRVVYRSTEIVRWNRNHVVLNSGGYETVTTKRKMNQASNQYGLGYGVSQRNYEWFVTLPNGREIPFVDGMQFERES